MAQESQKKVHFPNDDEADLITLSDEAGKEVEFEIIAGIEYRDNYYALLVPSQAIDGVDDDEAVIFKVEEDEKDPEYINYLPVEDEDEQEAVFAEYLKAVEAEGYEE